MLRPMDTVIIIGIWHIVHTYRMAIDVNNNGQFSNQTILTELLASFYQKRSPEVE